MGKTEADLEKNRQLVQFLSQIEGVKAMAKTMQNPPGYAKSLRFGVCWHNGILYSAFKCSLEKEGGAKLDGIVKDPANTAKVDKETNDALQQAIHDFIRSEYAKGREVHLEADTESLVETYYKRGYKLDKKYFAGERPQDVDQARWENRRPTRAERVVIGKKKTDPRWIMSRTELEEKE